MKHFKIRGKDENIQWPEIQMRERCTALCCHSIDVDQHENDRVYIVAHDQAQTTG